MLVLIRGATSSHDDDWVLVVACPARDRTIVDSFFLLNPNWIFSDKNLCSTLSGGSAGNHPHQSTIHSIGVLRTLNRDQYLLFISFPMNSWGILDSHKECPMCSNSVQLFIWSFLPRDFSSYSSTSPVLDHTSCNSLVLLPTIIYSHIIIVTHKCWELTWNTSI